jgi:hypothetical protein
MHLQSYHILGIVRQAIFGIAFPLSLPSPTDLLIYLANGETVIGAIYTFASLLKGLAILLQFFRKSFNEFLHQVRPSSRHGGPTLDEEEKVA